jgi:hypothetical protein
VADVQSQLVSFTRPPKQITADIPASPLDTPNFTRIPVPSGFIDQGIGVVNTDFGTDCENGSLIVPASPDETLRVRYEQILLTPQEKQDLLDQLNQPGSVPDLLPGQVINRIISAFNLNLSEVSTGNPINSHIPELIMRTCFKAEFSPETPLVLRLDQASDTYLRPVQEYNYPTRVLVTYPDQTGTSFVVVTFGQTNGTTESINPAAVEEIAQAGQNSALEEAFFTSILRQFIPDTIIPAGLPGASQIDQASELIEPATWPRTGEIDGATVLLWSLLGAVSIGLVALGLWWWKAKRA